MKSKHPSISLVFGGLLCYIPATSVSQESKAPTKISSFQERRLEILQQFDANHDGRLDPSERETLRLSRKQKPSTQPSPWKIPEKFLAKYDKNKDGDMSPDEWGVAWELETGILTKKFDANTNGSLEPDEIGAMMKAVSENVITGVPAFFAMRMAGDSRNNAKENDSSKPWTQFDVDGDGYASADELKALRQSLNLK